ncbi:MAG TPA: hypothetical protein VNF07_03415 [Acidimicrobiales bacterium]|nr:hypothetical protein [Acidimicrobiales bacterium]
MKLSVPAHPSLAAAGAAEGHSPPRNDPRTPAGGTRVAGRGPGAAPLGGVAADGVPGR